jgi:hypothetical protein
MPFRQLPTTDAGRSQALNAAKSKADTTTNAAQRVISAETRTALDTLAPLFNQEVLERGTALSEQTAASSALALSVSSLRTLVSHYFQVMNFAIARGEIPATARALYQIDVGDESVPALSREADVDLWARRIAEGEKARTDAGGLPMAMPSAAQVAAAYTNFTEKQKAQSNSKDHFDKEQGDVVNLREKVDDTIRDTWDEVEFAFRREDPPNLRRKAREWGVVYALRPNEPEEPTPAPEPAPGT